jgi:hypothetical protein
LVPLRNLITVCRDDAHKPNPLKVRIVPLAEHDVNGVPLVPQVWIAGNNGDVLRECSGREARPDFADNVRQSVQDAYH